MPIKLPDLASGKAIRLVACGKILKPSVALSEWLRTSRALYYAYRTRRKRYYTRLLTGGKANHFHLEIVSSDVMPPPPKTLLSSRTEFEDATSETLGCEISVSSSCFFIVPLDSLSPTAVIRTLSAETNTAGVSMKLTSGGLSVKGSPIGEIEWRLMDDQESGMIQIGITSVLSKVITENYLKELLQFMRSLFETFILTQEPKT